MKRTKNMRVEESTESRELFLYCVNTERLYTQSILPALNNLKRRYNRGVFDSEKAVDLFYYVACNGAEMYKKDFGYSFTVTERFTAAAEMLNYFMDEITA